jgi:tetratricopeptide (TPR) repeat protein
MAVLAPSSPVQRDPAPPSRRTRRRAFALVASGAFVAGAFAIGATVAGSPDPAATPIAVGVPTATDPIDELRGQLASVPADWPGWAALGGLQLERARAGGDPARYAEAEASFRRSLEIQPTDNVAALAGLAAVDAARHDFAAGLAGAQRALAINPMSPEALAVLTDCLTELGRYDEALDAARRLDRVRPSVASFARLSYQFELRGDVPGALDLMRRAGEDATTPAQVAFARAQEGLLALSTGDLSGARDAWRAGTRIADGDAALTYLGARIDWAAGREQAAIDGYTAAAARRPTLGYVQAQAEALDAVGDDDGAGDALEVARAAARLATDAGLVPEATDVLFEADHGDPGRAVALAERVYRAAPSLAAADAYAWALHGAGRHAEAIHYADRALRLGTANALWRYHRGAILHAIGRDRDAAGDLRTAIGLEPRFSALHAPAARALLDRIEGSR